MNDMAGKTVVITGASSGIGAEAARTLAGRGATVIPIGRDPARTTALAHELGVEPLLADFASLKDVQRVGQEVLERCPRIDVFAHNAGAMNSERHTTIDGHELTIQSNYLAPFLLHSILFDTLQKSQARVVCTSSLAHRLGRVDPENLDRQGRRYSPVLTYGSSKLAILMFAREVARQHGDTHISAVAFHPGFVRTNFVTDVKGPSARIYRTRLGHAVSIDTVAGAAPLVYLATTPDADSINGQYFDRLKPGGRTASPARDPESTRRLWDRTRRILNLA